MKYIYVDNSNLWLGGGSIAAVRRELAADVENVTNSERIDAAWRIDYKKLYKMLSDGDTEIGCAKLWGSEPPNDPFWEMVRKAGFEAEHWARNFANKEKGVDAAIVRQITKDEYSGKIDKDNDEIVLVSGGADFAPMVKELVDTGFKVTVYAWNHGLSANLQESDAPIIDLTLCFNQISL